MRELLITVFAKCQKCVKIVKYTLYINYGESACNHIIMYENPIKTYYRV